MDELKVQQSNGSITTNLDVIEAELKEKMAEYKDYVVSENTVKKDKSVLADLRKLRASLDDSRKEVKKLWLEPYTKFEERCKTVIALVDEPIDLINTQIKMFDEEKKLQKIEHIKELYAENIQGLERYLPFEKVLEANKKWTNVSTKDSDIVYDLNEMVLKIKNDLCAIRALGSEIENECIDAYVNFGNNLSMAIQRNSQYLSDKAVLEEKARNTTEPEKDLVNDPVNVTQNPLEGTLLNEFVEQTKTVKIVIAESDLQQVENILSFSDIKYQVIK